MVREKGKEGKWDGGNRRKKKTIAKADTPERLISQGKKKTVILSFKHL